MTPRTSPTPAERADAAHTGDGATRTTHQRITEALDRSVAADAADRLAATWTKESPR
ncbi:hypothetical protein [Kitasatospora sp. NPDC056184]|uniref:hypothetical protein n=1 Tax=Kitasatospora sp. NPDC056184 TaxID=3345738 RepID=UPI0035DC1E3E